MGGEGGTALFSDGKGGVGLASDESLFGADEAHFLQIAGMAGQIAVREPEQRLQGGEVRRLVGHQDGHDAEARLAFEGLIETVQLVNHYFLSYLRV